MEMYMEVDVITLQCVVEKFRSPSMESYGNLDPTKYISLPAYAWDAMLQMTKVELDLISDKNPEMHYFFERCV